MIQLFIFDMDGVLFDTEPIYKEINETLYRELQIEITGEEYQSFIGIASDKKWRYIRDKHGLDASVDALMKMSKQRKYHQLKNTRIKPIAGVEKLLQDIVSAGFPAVLASSSSRNIIRHLTSSSGLDSYFDYFVSGEDIIRGKPEPDIFLKAMSYYQVKPAECVVFEDSRNGILAAKAAGMKVLGFKSEASNQDLSLADLLVSDYQELSLSSLLGRF